ncbi:hypothetical protein AJ79_01274 [Helicocarpus griseus UAMH5409]|uniref:Uncharacterized protein n=1 Tax=Helicocarpus griseus UAMH5409 TaxID=1447875 RepID=A0A2B7Y6J1_9EURO|nr:hypothetical protein AJ79_01274 [Helicocarpus griseus UAMH5409]
MSSRSIFLRHYRLPNSSGLTPCRSIRPQLKEPVKNVSQRRCHATGRSIPRVMEPSVWTSLIPKFLRNRDWRGTQSTPRKSREPNPATFFVIIFTLIGSQAIRMIMLRNEYANYTRSADAKIRLLGEVIERLQRGEDVDVKRLLGTGDEAKEREWEEVLKEIEQEESLWHSKSKRTHRRGVSKSDEREPQQSTPPEVMATEEKTTHQPTPPKNEPPAKQNTPQRPTTFF